MLWSNFKKVLEFFLWRRSEFKKFLAKIMSFSGEGLSETEIQTNDEEIGGLSAQHSTRWSYTWCKPGIHSQGITRYNQWCTVPGTSWFRFQHFLNFWFQFQSTFFDSNSTDMPALNDSSIFDLVPVSDISKALIPIPIPGLQWVIPIPFPIPTHSDFLDSDSDSSPKECDSGIDSDSLIGIMHHWLQRGSARCQACFYLQGNGFCLQC